MKERDRCDDVRDWLTDLSDVPADELLPLAFEVARRALAPAGRLGYLAAPATAPR